MQIYKIKLKQNNIIEKLSKSTGFTNIVLPEFSWGKDISDYYKGLEDKNVFKETIESLIKTSII